VAGPEDPEEAGRVGKEVKGSAVEVARVVVPERGVRVVAVLVRDDF
jgi:hypothetical protein